MNFSLPLGILFGGAVIFWSILSELKNPLIFANAHALIIVFGGTMAAALVCFPFSHIFTIFRVIWRALLGRGEAIRLETLKEIVSLAELTSQGQSIQGRLDNIKNPFLKESIELVEDATLTNDELEEVLLKRVESQNERYEREGRTFKIIGKFPPAFGLIGATLGMIALLQGLGEPDAFERLGPAMSVALTATFWGLVFANLVLIPLGENLEMATDEDLLMRKMVVDGVMLLKERKHPILVEEVLKSHLVPSERNKIKK